MFIRAGAAIAVANAPPLPALQRAALPFPVIPRVRASLFASLFSFRAYSLSPFSSLRLAFSGPPPPSPPSSQRSRCTHTGVLSCYVACTRCACARCLRAFRPRFRNARRRAPDAREFAMVTSGRIWISAHFCALYRSFLFLLSLFPRYAPPCNFVRSSWNNAIRGGLKERASLKSVKLCGMLRKVDYSYLKS